MIERNLVLIGFMGSGKTSVGVKLSYRLKLTVEDTDKLVERRENKKISDIFAQEGEAYFRRKETELLNELSEKKQGARIYSVGGGTPVEPENRSLLKRLGTVIWLRVRPETVYERLRYDTTRPLLQCEDPLSRICELMDARRAAYEACADIVVDVDDKDMEDILDIIMEELESKNVLSKH